MYCSLLEPCAGKLASTVLRGRERSNALLLPGGSKFIEVPTRSVKPTQRCHVCGTTQKRGLSERRWVCACGAHHARDVNAPRTMLRYAYEGAWWDTKPGAGTAPAALVA